MFATAGAVHGVYPWNEPTKRVMTDDEVFHGGDSKARIAICLGCERHECINCFETHGKYKPRTNRKDRMCRMREQFIELYSKGVNGKEICNEMHISKATYFSYKKKFVEEEKQI